jgi:GxxExxY protein
MGNLIYRDECYQIMGAAFEVYKLKGCGFLEAVYQECLEIEFELQGLTAAPKVPLPLDYKGRVLKSRFQADFIAFDRIIIELKAVSCLTDEHRAQVLNYLHATGHRLGLLINFGHHPKLEWERLVV